MTVAAPPRRAGAPPPAEGQLRIPVARDAAREGQTAIPVAVLMYRSFAFFMAQLVDTAGKPMAVKWHHRRWAKLLEEFLRLAFLAPRGHGKSWEALTYLLWRAWRHNRDPETGLLRPGSPDGGLSLLHVTSTLDVSLAQSEVLQEIVLANQHVFGDMTPPEALGASRQGRNRRRWSSRHIRFTNEADLMLKSWGSAMRGLHPHRVVLDDILREETTFTDYQRQKTWRRFQGVVAPMIQPGGQIVVVGTAFHYADLLHRLRSTPGWAEGWRKYRALDEAADPPRALWPERHPVEELLKARASDPLMFAREFQNDPRDDASSLFPNALTAPLIVRGRWLPGLRHVERDGRREIILLSGDMALSQGAGADYCDIKVVRYDRVTQRRRLLRAWHERGLGLHEQVGLLRLACASFGVDLGVVEGNSFQTWVHAEAEKWPETAGRIFSHTTGVEKQSYRDGVPLLVGVFQQGLWEVPDGTDPDDPAHPVVDAQAADYARIWQAELNAFGWQNDKLQGAGEHDDTVMSTWLMERAVRIITQLLSAPRDGEVVSGEELGLQRVTIGSDPDQEADLLL